MSTRFDRLITVDLHDPVIGSMFTVYRRRISIGGMRLVQQLVDIVPVQGLAFQQSSRQGRRLVKVARENLVRFFFHSVCDLLYFLIDDAGGVFAVVLVLRQFLTQERVVFSLLEDNRPDLIAHASQTMRRASSVAFFRSSPAPEGEPFCAIVDDIPTR